MQFPVRVTAPTRKASGVQAKYNTHALRFQINVNVTCQIMGLNTTICALVHWSAVLTHFPPYLH